MKFVKGLLATQPTIVTTVVTAGVSLAIAYGAPIPSDAKAPLIALLVALATAFLHQTVTSPASVHDAVVDATVQTAKDLTAATAGEPGKITDSAVGVTSNVVSNVIDNVGGLIPKLLKG